MTPVEFTFVIGAISVFAGLIGSLVGVGGGIIIVPALTLLMGVDIHHAVAASIVGVVATSSSAASSYVKNRITNIRLGMLLETCTVLGAICGAMLATVISGRFLFTLFGIILTWTAWNMWVKKSTEGRARKKDKLAEKLNLDASFYDKSLKREFSYSVGNTKLGLATSWLAGTVSALLGIGGGVLKVPVMNLGMGVPIKAATATSNFMIGITAATGAAVYFSRGDVNPFIAGPVAVGIIIGAKIGSRLMSGLHGNVIKIIFVTMLALTAIQMLWKGIAG